MKSDSSVGTVRIRVKHEHQHTVYQRRSRKSYALLFIGKQRWDRFGVCERTIKCIKSMIAMLRQAYVVLLGFRDSVCGGVGRDEGHLINASQV